jgi:hypothetical protein
MTVTKPNIVSRIGRIPTGNHGGPRAAQPTHITDHHIVGDAIHAINRFEQAGQEASSTFIIGSDGTIYQELDIMTIPYTDSNMTSNRRAITIEHAGGHANYPYTEAMYKSSIHLHAWLKQQYGIPNSNILQHKQVTLPTRPTACAGGLNTDRIKKDSDTLLQGGSMSKDALTKEEVIELHYAYFIGGPGAGSGYEHVGQPLGKLIQDWKNSGYRKNVLDRYNAFDANVNTINALNRAVADLNAKIQTLTSNDDADKARIAELQAQSVALKKLSDDLQVQNNELVLEKDYATKTGNAFTRWLGEQLNKIIGKG